MDANKQANNCSTTGQSLMLLKEVLYVYQSENEIQLNKAKL